MSAIENTNRVIAAALIAPVPAGTLDKQLMYSKGIKSFTRLGVGRYGLVLEEPGGSNEVLVHFGDPANQNAILGGQVLSASQAFALGLPTGAVLITAYDGTQTAADPLFFYVELLKYNEGEGGGVALPIQSALTPLSGGGALRGYIYGYEPNSPDDITDTQVLLGLDTQNVAASDDNSPVTMSSTPLLIDSDTVGAGGLDTGTLAADTWYSLYVISNAAGTLVAGLMALAFPTAPVMPTGYTKKRRVGSVLTIGGEGGAQILKTFTCQGKGNDRRYQWQSYINVLDTGTATVTTPVDLSTAMPPTVSSFAQLRVSLESPTGVPGNLFFGKGSPPGHILSQSGQADPDGTPLALDYLVQEELVVALDVLAPPAINYSLSAATQQTSMDVVGWFESV